ncbi:MAG: DNA recombination protein RmuC [Gammaproteobacteria bacterium]|nr:DNA recombination protein RmuC [Gammaproteobacteria bacterium]
MLNIIVFVLVTVVIIYNIYLIINSKKLNAQILELEKENICLNTQNSNFKQQSKILETQFENYISKILNNKTEILTREANTSINNIILPLREKLTEFQQKVEQTYQNESREIFSLKNEINKLLANNISMARETQSLTQALKGSAKAQGVWGEIILAKILESSGLREGEEYVTQGRDLQLRSADNKILKPDVIINLPDNKHLIIDAKVSLTNYEQYIEAVNAGDKQSEQENLHLFLKSVQKHINNLSSKKYQYTENLATPDFVMLFLPIEGAFSLALQVMPELLTEAWDNKIVIVSPTTLFATLKTIASIWLFEKQNRNAIIVAKESGLLYDKFVAFTEDLTKIGQAITKADEAYHLAVNKLTTGKGNIVAKAEKIRELGAKTSKKLKPEWKNSVDTDTDINNEHNFVNSISSDSNVTVET